MVVTQKEPVEKFAEKPIEPIHDYQRQPQHVEKTLPQGAIQKISGLSAKQQETSLALAKKMLELPGIETRPEIANVLNEIVKTKGASISAAKALVNEKEQIYSLEITTKGREL